MTRGSSSETMEAELRKISRQIRTKWPQVRGVFYGMTAHEALDCIADNLAEARQSGTKG